MYATEGHMMAGMREKAIPIIETGIHSEIFVYAMMRYTGMRRTHPNVMKSARFPILSTRSPNNGVAIIADMGRRLLKKPADSRAMSSAAPPKWVSMKNLMANVEDIA